MAQLRSKHDCHQATGGTGTIENAGSSTCQRSLRIVTYNMHGFNQGFSTVKDLCSSIKPDVFMLQEHWLTPANFNKFDNIFPEYFTFGNSAMISSIERGILRGRPFGGVTFLIHSNLRAATRTVFSSDRCVIGRSGGRTNYRRTAQDTAGQHRTTQDSTGHRRTTAGQHRTAQDTAVHREILQETKKQLLLSIYKELIYV